MILRGRSLALKPAGASIHLVARGFERLEFARCIERWLAETYRKREFRLQGRPLSNEERSRQAEAFRRPSA